MLDVSGAVFYGWKRLSDRHCSRRKKGIELSKYFRLAASAAVCCSIWDVAYAQLPNQDETELRQEDESVFIRADRVINNALDRQTIAEGNVEVHYGPRVLRADRVIYEVDTGVVRCSRQCADH